MVVILGCPFPVILRLIETEYLFVGECFVHGIMDGEAASEESVCEVDLTLW